MPEKWTGRLVGRMHNECISFEELANELGFTKPYVSMILNSKRKPPNIRERMEQAVDRIVDRHKRKNQEGDGERGSTDCEAQT